MTIPPPPAATTSGTSSRATTALVLGILGVVCCQLCAPFAWYMGSKELKAIKSGASPQSAQGFAMAGMVLGIVGSILFILALLWIVFAGGMAVLSAMAGAGGG
jgi:hypothetical protein